MHCWVAIRYIITVSIGIEEQVRRVEHPNSAAATPPRRHNVQPIKKGRVLVENPVPLRILVNGDFIQAFEVTRGWRRNFVIDGPPEAVMADHPQSRRRWILAVLHDPHSAALVEIQKHRLSDD